MAEPGPLHLIRKHVSSLQALEQRRDEAIISAFSPTLRDYFGYTVDDIAEAAGVSRQRIYQIVKESDREVM